jgi:hypothetical protein
VRIRRYLEPIGIILWHVMYMPRRLAPPEPVHRFTYQRIHRQERDPLSLPSVKELSDRLE